MNEAALNKQVEHINRLVADLFMVDAYYLQGKQVVFSLSYKFGPVKSKKLLEDRLNLAGYDFTINPSDDALLLTITPRRRLRIPRLNVILFIVTLVSVYFVPVFFFNLAAFSWKEAFHNTLADLARGRGLEFTIALMSMLIVHEMGHFVASRRRGIVTSWPYFIPAPNIIGTFGAVIKSKSPFWNRRDLIEVGAAGPVAGWIVAFFWLIYGLSHTAIVSSPTAAEVGMLFTLDGESLLIRFLVPILVGHAGPGEYYAFTEAAFAGWVGLLVTAINMLPIGQLDGGHVIYGLAPRRQAMLGWLGLGLLFVLGFQSMVWWVFAALGFIMGAAHPPTLDDRKNPGRAARTLGWAALVILLLSFTPVPFR